MQTTIVIEGIVHGLNGKDGLIREHYRTSKKKKEKYKALFLEQTSNRHAGKVTIEYIGYKSVLMDWDNFAASFKHLGDSLVSAGIIKDDNPSIIVEFMPTQIKSKRINQRCVIKIKDYEK